MLTVCPEQFCKKKSQATADHRLPAQIFLLIFLIHKTDHVFYLFIFSCAKQQHWRIPVSIQNFIKIYAENGFFRQYTKKISQKGRLLNQDIQRKNIIVIRVDIMRGIKLPETEISLCQVIMMIIAYMSTVPTKNKNSSINLCV